MFGFLPGERASNKKQWSLKPQLQLLERYIEYQQAFTTDHASRTGSQRSHGSFGELPSLEVRLFSSTTLLCFLHN